jgi:hypothetical protein
MSLSLAVKQVGKRDSEKEIHQEGEGPHRQVVEQEYLRVTVWHSVP